MMYNHQDWTPTTIGSGKKKVDIKENRPGTKELNRLTEDNVPSLKKISIQQSQDMIVERNKKNITQAQIAKIMNIPVQEIQNFENIQKSQTVFNSKLYNNVMKKLKSLPTKA